MADDLTRFDRLIAALTAVIEEPEEATFLPVAGQPGRRGTLRLLIQGAAREQARQPLLPVEALLFDGTNLVLRGKNEAVKNANVEVRILMAKTGRGESFRVCTGVVAAARRISGGYEFLVKVSESRREQVAAAQRLRECLEKKDAPAWERWCADLAEGVDLRGVDLHGAALAGFDLCCANLQGADLSDADLSGANLSGANLEKTRLGGARTAGTDFFRARVPREFEPLVVQSGLVEVQSVDYAQ